MNKPTLNEPTMNKLTLKEPAIKLSRWLKLIITEYLPCEKFNACVMRRGDPVIAVFNNVIDQLGAVD